MNYMRFSVPALASLVEASFVEDVYGVVQMSLPEIIKAMLNLQEVCMGFY